MTEYVMKCLGYAKPLACPYEGWYLKEFMPFAENIKGIFTADIRKAKRFPSRADAMKVWMTSIGTRPDGKPDRPLTAFSVEILEAK